MPQSDSNQLQVTTDSIAAPTNLIVTRSTGSNALAWDDNATNEDSYYVYRSTVSSPSFPGDYTKISTLSADTTSYNDTAPGSSGTYHYAVTAGQDTTESDPATTSISLEEDFVTDTTELPDAQQPTLGNGVEDEVAVGWTDVTDYGEYVIQIRETGTSSWDSNATGFAEATVSEATTSTTFTGREDGEEYEVRMRTQTEHVTGSWTTPESIVTAFPGATDLTTTDHTNTSISLSWTDNSDNEDGFRIEERHEQDPLSDTIDYTPWQTATTVGPNTTSETITGLESNTQYEVRIIAYTEDAEAPSNTITQTTAITYDDNWTMVLQRPDGHRVPINEDNILTTDINRPHTEMADFRVDVPDSSKSLQSWVTSVNKARIYFNGQILFNGYLERSKTNERRGTTSLEGRGILRDLKDREEVITYQRITVAQAIKDALDNYTDFDATVYSSDVNTLVTGGTVVNLTTTSDFSNSVSFNDDAPLEARNGNIELLETCQFIEGEDAGPEYGKTSAASNGAYGGGTQSSDSFSHTFDYDYTVPDGELTLWWRYRCTGESDTGPKLDVNVDGTTIKSYTDSWGGPSDFTMGTITANVGDVSGNVTVQFDIQGSGGTIEIDAFGLLDDGDRFGGFSYDLSGSLSGGYLVGPQLLPAEFQAVFDTQNVPFNVERIKASGTFNDVSNNQAIATSADGQQTWQEATNTSSVDNNYPNNAGTTIDYRVSLGRTDETRTSAAPTKGFNGQVLHDIEVVYDGTDRPVIDNQRYEGDMLTIIQKLHRRGDYRLVPDHGATDSNGDPVKVVESFQRGTQDRTADLDVINRKPATDTYDYYNHITVRGGRLDDGTRPAATAEDLDEIKEIGQEGSNPNWYEDGKRHLDLKRPDLETLDEVKSVARKELTKRLSQRSATGDLDIHPANILPGYDYTVDWHGDGNPTRSTSEAVKFGERYASTSGQITFERTGSTEAEIIEARFERETTRDAI